MIIVDGFPLDCTISEEHNYESEATMYPMESGVEVTDHIRSKPIVVSIEGIVTDTPLEAVAALRPRSATVAININAQTGESTIVPHKAPPYSQQAIDHMLEIHDSRTPVKLVTSIKTYTNMVMISFTPKKQGDSALISATFQQVRFVTNARTTVRVAVPQHAKRKVIQGTPTNLESRGQAIIEVRDPGDDKPIADNPHYFRPDGSKVSDADYEKAVRDAGAIPLKQIPDPSAPGGFRSVPADPKDYQPYVPKNQRPPWWQTQKGSPNVTIGKATRIVR
jgi:hypothetical protein